MSRGFLWLALLLAAPLAAGPLDPERLVADARSQVGITLGYDPAYRRLDYPGGDVPLASGVCSDVVIRALRGQGLDLQQALHEDMRANFAAYPNHWNLRRPDRNIDHRRVPNLMTWFKRQGWSLPVSDQPRAYRAGDVVAWSLGGGLTHIGIVTDRQARSGTPLILHNIGAGAREEDLLFSFPIIGHYRPAMVDG